MRKGTEKGNQDHLKYRAAAKARETRTLPFEKKPDQGCDRGL